MVKNVDECFQKLKGDVLNRLVCPQANDINTLNPVVERVLEICTQVRVQ